MSNHPPMNKWFLVAMLSVVVFLNYADRSVLAAVIPKVESDYGWTSADLGIISSALLWVYALLTPIGGYIGDKMSRKKLIIITLIIWSFTVFINPLASTFLMFTIIRAATGFGEAFYMPTAIGLISTYHDTTTRSRALSFHQVGVALGAMIGPLFAATLAEKYTWQYSFYIYGILGFILAAILWKYLKDPSLQSADSLPASKQKKIPLSKIFKIPSVSISAIGGAMGLFIIWSLNTWLPAYLYEQFHMSLAEAAFYGAALYHVAVIGGVLLGGFVADALTKKTILARYYIWSVGMFLSAPFIYIIGTTSNVNIAIMGILGVGVAKGFIDSNQQAAPQDIAPVAYRSTIAGIVTFVGLLAAAGAPYSIGAYGMKVGLGHALSLVSILGLIGGFIFIVFRNVLRADILKNCDNH